MSRTDLSPEQASRWSVFAVEQLSESIATKQRVIESCIPSLIEIASRTADLFQSGGRLYLAGNGGSAADAQHLAAEFVCRLSSDFTRPGLPAMALTTDTSVITAHANDIAFDDIFARQISAFGKVGDGLIVFSTSGNSKNLVAAVETAKALGVVTFGFLGGEGGILAKSVDYSLVVPSPKTQHVQESHIALYHIYCAVVERLVFDQ